MVVDLEEIKNKKINYAAFESQKLEELLQGKTCKLCGVKAIAAYSQEGKEFEFYCRKHLEVALNFANTALNYLTPFFLYVRYRGK